MHSISVLEDKNIFVRFSTFTFPANCSYFIQLNAVIQILPVLGAYSMCERFRKGVT